MCEGGSLNEDDADEWMSLLQIWSEDEDGAVSKLSDNTHGANDTQMCDTQGHLSKEEKKLERFLKMKEKKKDKERRRREEKCKDQNSEDVKKKVKECPTKKEVKEKIRTKLQEVQTGSCGPRICIDLSLAHLMSRKVLNCFTALPTYPVVLCHKNTVQNMIEYIKTLKDEMNKLAGQIRRLYGSNRKAACPLHLTLASLDPCGMVHGACMEKNDGFAHYQINTTAESYLDIYEKEEIIYLTPDSDKVLTSLEEDKVYILGGLVDESPQKNHTANLAKQESLATARLPIDEFMTKGDSGTFSKILAINQVFEILLTYRQTQNWTEALLAGIPPRKGYVPK